MSHDPHDPWEVRLELVDDSDSMRWCTASDLWDRNERAIEVAREERHLDNLVALLNDVVAGSRRRCRASPISHSSTSPPESNSISETAEDFIDVAPFELERAGVELIGPERLIRNTVRVSGEATPTPQDDRKKQFGREALVEWKLVVGDEEISEAELERAAEAGATLLHTGDRWVRIDADELRRKRDKMRELEETRSRVTPLELLQLANDDDATEERPTIVVHTAGDHLDSVGFDGLELGVDADDDGLIIRPPTHRSPRPTGSGACSTVCPTSASKKSRSRANSSASCAITSVAASRGCSSCRGSASAAASPTTWGSARPPPRSPTWSSGRARTSSCAHSLSCATGIPSRTGSPRSSKYRSTTDRSVTSSSI